MQAARVAAWRGHDVSLWEKGRYLGGSMSLAAMVKGFMIEDVREVIWFLRRQVKKYGVDVQLGKEIDAAISSQARCGDHRGGWEAYATGHAGICGRTSSEAAISTAPSSSICACSGQNLRDLTGVWMPVGKTAVIIGSAIQGCQLGEFLTKRGRKVTIVDTEEELGKMMYPERKTRLFYWFDTKGVERLAGVNLVEITKKGLTLVTKEGETRTIEADSVIAPPFTGDTTWKTPCRARS
jgi:2,4-dienoyl-CoA reductase (NADPH2)